MGDAHLVHHLVDPGAPLARGDVVVEQRKLDILADGELVDEIEGLEDEADVPLAEVGESSMPITFRSVDLPQPDGPMIATNSPSATSRKMPSRAVVSTVSVR